MKAKDKSDWQGLEKGLEHSERCFQVCVGFNLFWLCAGLVFMP